MLPPRIGDRAGQNTFAIVGFGCAVVGILLVPFVLGPLGVIFSAIGWKRANQGLRWRGVAIAGVVVGSIEFLFAIVLLVALGAHYA